MSVEEMEEFLPMWQKDGQPLLVTGLAKAMVTHMWSFDHIM